MPELDLSPEALARIAPGFSLSQLGQLAEPPIAREHLCRLRSGKHVATEATLRRLEAALTRARVLAQAGRLVMPKSPGRPPSRAKAHEC